MTPKERIRAAAQSYAPLVALLGSSPFRWYDMRMPAGAAKPCVVYQQISGAPVYVVTGRLPTGWGRWQFTIWGSGSDSTSALQVEAVLLRWFDQLNLIDIPGLGTYPVRVLLQMDTLISNMEPPVYGRIIDASLFSNDAT